MSRSRAEEREDGTARKISLNLGLASQPITTNLCAPILLYIYVTSKINSISLIFCARCGCWLSEPSWHGGDRGCYGLSHGILPGTGQGQAILVSVLLGGIILIGSDSLDEWLARSFNTCGHLLHRVRANRDVCCIARVDNCQHKVE